MQDFTGIVEKLKRAEENINNLYSEMDRFFQESDYPTFPENDPELRLKAIEYHSNLTIPPRFSVLTGEIVHHLRSCFDHLVWHFSVGPIKNPRQVEFPVFKERPVNQDRCAAYERKVQGVMDSSVRALIEGLQPYNATDPVDSPLQLIHDFDIVDKHQGLILCVRAKARALPREMRGELECYQREHPELDTAQVASHFKAHGPSQPCIAFRNFGRREGEPISEGSIKLFYYTLGAVGAFKAL